MTRCVHCGSVTNRSIPGLRLDLAGGELFLDGTIIKLCRQRADVMAGLIDAYPRKVTRVAFEEVVPSVRGISNQTTSIDVAICYLRKHLVGSRYSIKLERGKGYRLENGERQC
jgi:DNA-binding response OmpR family regulator